jgi:hypothetical protein
MRTLLRCPQSDRLSPGYDVLLKKYLLPFFVRHERAKARCKTRNRSKCVCVDRTFQWIVVPIDVCRVRRAELSYSLRRQAEDRVLRFAGLRNLQDFCRNAGRVNPNTPTSPMECGRSTTDRRVARLEVVFCRSFRKGFPCRIRLSAKSETSEES